MLSEQVHLVLFMFEGEDVSDKHGLASLGEVIKEGAEDIGCLRLFSPVLPVLSEND